LLERRNPLRRAVCGGVVIGALAGALTGLGTGVALAALTTARALPGRELVALLAVLAGVYALFGVGFGAVTAALMSAADPAVDALARKRQRRVRAAASLYTLFATPIVALLWSFVLAGPWAHGWAAHGWLLLGGAVGSCVLAHYLLWGMFACAERIDLAARRGEGRIGPALLAALLLGAAGTAMRFADVGAGAPASDAEHSLHLAAALGSLGLWTLAVLAASKAARAGERRWGKLAAPRAALAVAVLTVTLGALALAHLRGPEAALRRELLRGHDALAGGVVGDGD
jgi:MFS family permease